VARHGWSGSHIAQEREAPARGFLSAVKLKFQASVFFLSMREAVNMAATPRYMAFGGYYAGFAD
jgi:hypothetical protein